MNPNVPAGAAILLDFIGGIEAPNGYGTIYANKQNALKTPLIEMTLDEIQAAQALWSKRNGSSAAGRYQFMRATLKVLMAELGLRGSQKFTPDLQDTLGYALLKRRGYAAFMAGTKTSRAFGNDLAKEWASLPVLTDTKGHKRDVKRGETYYAADGINKVLTTPEKVEAVLTKALSALPAAPQPVPRPIPAEPSQPAPEPPKAPKRGIAGWLVLAGVVAAALGWAAFNIPLPF